MLSRLQPSDLGPFKEIIQKEEEKLKNLFIIKRIEASWEKIVGPGLYPYSRPIDVNGNSLKIIVPNSAYKMEFTFIKDFILKNIDSLLEFHKIFSFKIVVGNFEPLNIKKPTVKRSLEGKESLLNLLEKEEDPVSRMKLRELIELL